MQEESKPKILIFTVTAWNSKVGANTWESILQGYDSAKLASVCIRDEQPDSPTCSRYFSISENKVLKSIFKRKLKTGREIEKVDEREYDTSDLEAHNERYRRMTKKRSTVKLLCRELVWKFGKWKTKELNDFLDDFQPDIILHSMEGYIHLNRIIDYAIRRTGAKAIGYIWDDNFTYKQSKKFGYKFLRFFQRKSLKKLAKRTQAFFAITPKTKREADEFFGIDCQVLSKPLNRFPTVSEYQNDKKPLKLLYTGNLLIGRDRTLQAVVDALQKINENRTEFEIDVYTQTTLTEEKAAGLNTPFCRIYPPIKQEEVLKLQQETDILLFLEDMSEANRTARLSFSTKITDYLSTGKCIFAAGNKDLAPMEYFENHQAALVAYSAEEIEENFNRILSDKRILKTYAQNGVNCGSENHHPDKIKKIFEEQIHKVIREERKKEFSGLLEKK